MKKALGIFTLSILLFGCTMNPSKEARIQKLETEMQNSLEQIEQLEKRVEILEQSNAVLTSKIEQMEINNSIMNE